MTYFVTSITTSDLQNDDMHRIRYIMSALHQESARY